MVDILPGIIVCDCYIFDAVRSQGLDCPRESQGISMCRISMTGDLMTNQIFLSLALVKAF